MFLNRKRLYILYGSIFFIFLFLVLRLIYLQIISSENLINSGNKRSLRIQNILKSRGVITDRMGRLLAVDIPVYSVWVDPQEISKCNGVYNDISSWSVISKILNIPIKKLFVLLNEHHTDRFVYLSRQVDSIVVQKIKKLKLSGIYIQQESKRYYPAGSSAAHLIGITNIDNQGIEGVEKSFDSWLSGCPKTRLVRQDRSRQVVEEIALLNHGCSPKSITLSIDERLQFVAYQELSNAVSLNKAESGSIVLIDINTGEILAMANSPSYDPNNFSIIDQSVMRNRAITDSFEPGSTIKPIVIMMALEHKVIEKDTIINTLPYVIHGHRIKDVSLHNELTISDILKKSSNVGISRLALSMPVSVLIDTYIKFGIGEMTNIGLIGENKGRIYSDIKYYSAIEHAALSYGYGLMLTPLQLAKVYATIGGMGLSRPISIIKIDNPVSLISSENQVFSESLVRTVIDMMDVTTLSNSGCCKAAIEGYRVAVKTGTIKKVGPHGKYINRYIACMAGVAPSSNPRFALAVVINDPKNGRYYGGSVSAPVFRSVMSSALKIMNVNPDFLQK
ncbi:penicillin-binding protein 3 precursor [Candidatus Blochmanniella floridana]|uniref:Peptidoglycan D,D-transpeptidase FtsI n=1 Tax=Blochmanniella floridana TaxID=203907 RepID=Q7VQJ3_BLOFL|nr:penicillin-binding protein 3 precursor [Candidatus Blochmannia floridanus]